MSGKSQNSVANEPQLFTGSVRLFKFYTNPEGKKMVFLKVENGDQGVDSVIADTEEVKDASSMRGGTLIGVRISYSLKGEDSLGRKQFKLEGWLNE